MKAGFVCHLCDPSSMGIYITCIIQYGTCLTHTHMHKAKPISFVTVTRQKKKREDFFPVNMGDFNEIVHALWYDTQMQSHG